ncbi:MAG: sulfatase-like hydrolase/transferase, partial [Bacteroidota bacterium]
MKQRHYLLIVFLACSAFSCNNEESDKKESNTPPNIIFIMSDDHAYHAVGAYEQLLSAVNPTPVLDELAAKGMLFTNVFCNNSICTPSRASIMTGQ